MLTRRLGARALTSAGPAGVMSVKMGLLRDHLEARLGLISVL